MILIVLRVVVVARPGIDSVGKITGRRRRDDDDDGDDDDGDDDNTKPRRTPPSTQQAAQPQSISVDIIYMI